MPFTYGQTVTVERRTVSGTDSYGNNVYSFVKEDVDLCVVQPSASSEQLQFADQLTTGITVFFPPNTDLSYIDAIIVDGDVYEVQGTPNEWVSPFSGHVGPVQVQATKVTGVSA